MSDLTPMPTPSARRFNGDPFVSRGESFQAKVKIRFIVDKQIDGEWVAMARLADLSRVEELSSALGGMIRVQDLAAGTATEKEYE